MSRWKEQWEQQGVSFICRTNPQYPARLLRRMGREGSPPTFYCIGATGLLDTIQTRMLLPPSNTNEMNKFAERLGKAAQFLGSTAASGADTCPEQTLLARATGQDSAVVGVVRGDCYGRPRPKSSSRGWPTGDCCRFRQSVRKMNDYERSQARCTGSGADAVSSDRWTRFTAAYIKLPPTDDENILDHWSLLSSQDIDRDYVGMLAASMMADEFFRYSESDEI